MDPSALKSPELQQIINEQQQKTMVNEMVAKITFVCCDKCITSRPGRKFIRYSERSCFTNCVDRYVDMSLQVMKRFQNMQ